MHFRCSDSGWITDQIGIGCQRENCDLGKRINENDEKSKDITMNINKDTSEHKNPNVKNGTLEEFDSDDSSDSKKTNNEGTNKDHDDENEELETIDENKDENNASEDDHETLDDIKQDTSNETLKDNKKDKEFQEGTDKNLTLNDESISEDKNEETIINEYEDYDEYQIEEEEGHEYVGSEKDKLSDSKEPKDEISESNEAKTGDSNEFIDDYNINETIEHVERQNLETFDNLALEEINRVM